MTNPELMKLADTITGHVAALASEPLRMPLTTWDVVSNDILTAAESLRRLASSDDGVKGEPVAFPTWDAEDEAYELGKRYGYESAVQDLDIATGGDGEFKGSTTPGGTVDVSAMKARIVGRTITAPPADAMREALEPFLIYLRQLRSQYPDSPSDTVIVGGPYNLTYAHFEAIETLTAPGATTKSDGWDGLDCSCGGGWKVGHAAGCPEDLAAPDTSDPSSTRSEVTVEELADWLFANLRTDTEPHQDARALLDQFEIRRK